MIIALVVVIGFSFAACDFEDDKDDDNGGGGDNLTITGLPKSSDYWTVRLFTAGTDISTISAFNSAAMSNNYLAQGNPYPPKSKNYNVLTIWYNSNGKIFTESGNWEVLLQDADDNKANSIIGRRATVNFSNGKATVPFSDFTPIQISY